MRRLVSDDSFEAVEDAIDSALSAHQLLDRDSRCSCGARNNMDGDVLHAHLVSVVSKAVQDAIFEGE